jgi:hypothetical protein
MYQHKAVAIEQLIPYALNSRTHSDEQVAQLAASIREFGFTNPVLVDEENNLIAGHGRVMAARKLGLTEVPAIIVTGMDDRKRRALIIADNKLALNAGWDEQALRVELEDLAGDYGALMGFSEDELAALLAEATVEESLTDEDAVPEVGPEPITKPGDVWVMGKHRLMCGDSTSIDAVDKLMAGQKADMVFTDPPYNVAFNGRSGKHEVIKNDDLAADDFDKFIGEVLQTIKAVNAPTYYIWCNWKFYATLQRELEYKACIVWVPKMFLEWEPITGTSTSFVCSTAVLTTTSKMNLICGKLKKTQTMFTQHKNLSPCRSELWVTTKKQKTFLTCLAAVVAH